VRHIRKSPKMSLAGVVLSVLLLEACSPGGGTTSTAGAELQATDAKAGEISPFCPDKPTKVFYVKAAGGTPWTTVAYTEYMAEAAKCPKVTAGMYNGSQGLQAAISATNAAVAQGNKILLVNSDFGAAQLPSMQAARKAGVTVVNLFNDIPSGKDGISWDVDMKMDADLIGKNEARWLADNVKPGKVVFIGGGAGVPTSQGQYDAFKKYLAEYAPDFELVNPDGYVVTDWDSAKKRQAMAGLIAKHGEFAAVVTDFLGTDLGVVQAFVDAKQKIPAMAGIASNQGWVCTANEYGVNYLAQDGTTSLPTSALRAGLAVNEGKKSPEPAPFQLSVYADTFAGKKPACEPGISPDADLSGTLSVDEVKKVLK
jgi:ribose transport system substrate-binding protein